MGDFERAKALLWARSYGRCEACGLATPARDPHHRQARGMGGVHGAAKVASNDVRNLLALCRICHDSVDAAPDLARAVGWLVVHPIDPYAIPVKIKTVNGPGWWFLRADGGFEWCDPDRAVAELGKRGVVAQPENWMYAPA